MSKEAKKKKGEFKVQKLRNKERQKVFDAIKQMREEGFAWLNIDKHRVKIASFEECEYPSNRHVLAKHNGRIRLCLLINKDGWTLHSHDFNKRFRKVQPGIPDVLAVVEEMHILTS